MRSPRALVIAVVVAGCGGSGPPPAADAGTLDGASGDASTGLVIAPPELPRLAPCPSGWRDVSSEVAPLCNPWPASGRADCPPDQAHFPGEPGCARVGAACPAGDFPDGLPASGRIVYVLASAPAGGDGTRGRPFQRIRDALPSAAGGGIVAIGKGRYEDNFRLRGNVTLWGACAAETVLAHSPGVSATTILTTVASHNVVRDLTVTGAELGAAAVSGVGAELVLEGVVIENARSGAVSASDSGVLTVRDSILRDVVYVPPVSSAAEVFRAGRLELHRVLVERAPTSALAVTDEGSSALVEGSVLRDCGEALAVAQTAGALEIAGTVLEGGAEGAPGALVRSVEGADVTVTGSFFSGGGELALVAREGAHARLASSSLADGIWYTAVSAYGVGTTLSVEDVSIRDVATSLGEGGRGVTAFDGAEATVRRVAIERASEVAVATGGPGTRLDVEDLLVSGTREAPSGLGRALHVQDGALLEVRRCRAVGHREASVTAIQGRAVLSDIEVDDTRGRACVPGCVDWSLGYALVSARDGEIVATTFAVRDSLTCGVLLAFGGSIDLTDGEVSGNMIGACLQVDGYDPTRLSRGVRYFENGTNLQATMLPVPSDGMPLGM